MPLYDVIQQNIDKGRGYAAKVLGPPHDVYRIGANSNGNFFDDDNKIATAVPVLTKVAYGGGLRQALETERQQGIIWYEVIGDMRPFLIGDVFLNTDPIYGAGHTGVTFETKEFKGFALADHSPIKKALAGRVNQLVKIYRLSKVTDSKQRWDRTRENDEPVILQNGQFCLGQNGQEATHIPVGLISTGKSYGDRVLDSMPAEQRKSGWELYMPALNGFRIREGDRIEANDGVRYVVIVPYTQYVGASGSQWFLERENAS